MTTLNIGLLAADMFEMERGYRAEAADLASWCQSHGCDWLSSKTEAFNAFGEEWSETTLELGSWSIPITPIIRSHSKVRGFNSIELVIDLLMQAICEESNGTLIRESFGKISADGNGFDVMASFSNYGIEQIDSHSGYDSGWMKLRVNWIEGENTWIQHFKWRD